MKIAVISDTHDNIWNIDKALQLIKEAKCEAIIFCGDFCAPFSADRLTRSGLPIYAVFGNNDEDQGAIIKMSGEKFNFSPLAQEFSELEFSGRKIAFCHYPKLARLLAETGDYDAVFYGHDHLKNVETVGKTLLCNPGAVCGIVNFEPGPATFAIYETETNKAELVEL